jgi:formylglycine-generating enzyme required for sulfatase activity/CheY-like chemotaxis protein
MRILLVDDDTSVLQGLMAALKGLDGHEVRPAISAEKALSNAEAAGGVDLLITDVVMEPLDGFGLRAELQKRYPEMRTIFISGYDLSEYGEQLAGDPLLTKPFEPETLIAAVREAFAPTPEPAAEAPIEPEPEIAAEAEPAGAPEPSAEDAPGDAEVMISHEIAPAEIAAESMDAIPAEIPAAESQPELAAAPDLPAPVRVATAAPSAPSAPQNPAGVPRAVPVAVQPSAAPRAVAVPRATPAQAATPAAVPKAVAAAPTAVPVAKAVAANAPAVVARAVPTATPATPKAVPSAPKVVTPASPAAAASAVPRAVPAAPKVVSASPPVAVPSAPRAVPAATPAVPKAVATPQAVPAAPRVVSAVPTAVAAAVKPVTAVAVPKAVPAAPRAVAAAAPAAAEHHSGSSALLSLLGQMIGGYQIVSQLGEGRWGPVFAAVQVAINRPVGLKLLDPERATDEQQKQRFVADARAKANVQHPSIISVYEAGAADQWIYYTREYVDGHTLAGMAAQGQKTDQPTALKIARVAAEGMLHFHKNTIPHAPLKAANVFLGVDGQPRLANLATQLSDQPSTVAEEIETLGRALLAVLPAGPGVTPPMRALLGRTQRAHNSPIPTWDALLQGVKALEPKVVPLEAARISAQDRAAVQAVEKARAQQRRAFMMNVAAMLSLVLLAAFAVWFVLVRSNARNLEAQVHIEGGEFISGTGTPSRLDEFWIDKFEVSIGQYAKFVEWIEANPSEEHAYDHPKQPRHLSHIPKFWQIYYKNALAKRAVHSVPQTLNAPMNRASWWDAYAYAKWKGRELPTELEWERAARGKRGQAFTWGEEPDPARANTNADFIEKDPAAKGKIDGFNYWGEVDRQKADKSPDGVIGMQGNVSEWTASWTPDERFPIIKGGNFMTGLQPLHTKVTNHEATLTDHDEWIGFRTISRKPPEKE